MGYVRLQSCERAHTITSRAPAGWYPDPGGNPSAMRYFDGQRWTSYTATRPYPVPPPTWNQQAEHTGVGWARPRRRVWPWVIGVIVIIIFIAAAWLAVSIGSTFVDELHQHPVW